MTLPYNSSAFDTHKCTGGHIEYPFRDSGDSTTKIYVHEMRGHRSTYSPLADDNTMTTATQKPSGSPFSDDSVAYYVGDTDTEDQGDGTVVYERKFANIPADRTEGGLLYPFTFPGSSSRRTSDISTSTSNESTSYDSATNEAIMIFNVSDASLYRVGQRVYVNNDNQGSGLFEYFYSGVGWIGFTMDDGIVSDISGSTITVREALPQTASNFRSGVTITTFTAGVKIASRSAITQNASSRRSYTYQKISNPEDLPILFKFQPLDGGVPTDTLDGLTQPTQDGYLNLIKTFGYIRAEDTQPTRWMGNIWELQNIEVRAQ